MFWAHHMPGFPFAVISNLIWLLLLVLLIGSIMRLLMGRRRTWGGYRTHAAPFPPPPPFPGPRQGFQPPQQFTALQILQQRYARGEIDGTTFDQMRERLEASERPEH